MTNTLKMLLVPIIFIFIILQCILLLHQDFKASELITLNQAYFIMKDTTSPPSFSTQPSQKRTLPDNWSVSQRKTEGSGWYNLRFNFQGKHKDMLWGLFIPRANMNVAVFMNGLEIGTSGHFSEPMSRNWARPLYYNFSTEHLLAGENNIYIHLKAYANDGGGISKVIIGPHQSVYPLYERLYFLQVDTSKGAFILNLFAGLLALVLWRLRPNDKVYAWFALVCFSSAFFISNHFVREIPVSREIWHHAVHVSIGWFAFSLQGFARSFLDYTNGKKHQLLVIYMLVSSVVLMLVQSTPLNLAWHIGSLLMAIYACFILFKKWLETKQTIYIVLSCAFLFTLMLGFHDWFTRLSHLQFSYPVLMHLGPPLMLMSVSWILLSRFIQYANQNEQFNQLLVERIEETTIQLNEEHTKVKAFLKTETQVQERARIMKDLHDGLGSYLISANSIARNNNVDAGLQQALNDAVFWLRTSIDTLDDTHGDIESLLGTFRYRIEPQLKSCGIQLQWHMDDLLGHSVASEHRLHLMRIIQECITNVIKHAEATHLYISTKLTEGDLITLTIEDNGCGFDDAAVGGHGMSNMRERVSSMGGEMLQLNPEKGSALQFVFQATSKKVIPS